MEQFFSDPQYIPLLQIVLATVFGMVLGIERLLAGRTAGPRTYGLVSMGSCLLTILSINSVYHFQDAPRAEPIGMIAAIISGIGFIGAGLIIFKGSKISGLTTAAGIWVAAAIGIAVGFGDYLLAFFTTFLTLFLFTIMWQIENRIRHLFIDKDNDEEHS